MLKNSNNVYDFWGAPKKSTPTPNTGFGQTPNTGLGTNPNSSFGQSQSRNSGLNLNQNQNYGYKQPQQSSMFNTSRCTCATGGRSTCPVHGAQSSVNNGLDNSTTQNSFGQSQMTSWAKPQQQNSWQQPQANNNPWEEEERKRQEMQRQQTSLQQTPQPDYTQMTTREVLEDQFRKAGWLDEEEEKQKQNAFVPPVPERKPRYAELGFDGQSLSWIENEEIKKSWPAMSGQPEYQGRDFTNVKDKGPIPEGKWLVNQDQGQNYYKDQDLLSRVLGLAGLGKWKGGTGTWGNNRVWINPAEGTDTRGRTDLSIHGGSSLGSAGCVDLAQNMDDFWEWYRKYGRNMNLNVGYPNNRW